ncbi:nuclear transport factor 2 family protein [Candidatus Poribacteria bacterium]|nr:nuclear transport factor 2 family protein [Candidatus Poribacteria bacterium]
MMLRVYIVCLMLLLSIISCKSQTLQEHLLEPPPPLTNFALSRNGATTDASQSVPNHRAEEIIDGDTTSETWDEGSGWGSSLEHLRTSDLNKRPYVVVTLAKPVDIRKIVMWTIDSEKYPAPQFGLKDYRIEYWHGTGWGLIPSGNTKDKQYTARNNTKGKRVHEVQQRLIAQKIRLVPVSSNDTVRNYQHMAGKRPVYEVEGIARVMELEVWGYTAPEVYTLKQIVQGIPPEAVGHTVLTETQTDKGETEPTTKETIQNVLNLYELGYDMADLAQVMSCFSEAYLSNGRTYQDVKTKAAHFFEVHHQIDMTLTDINIHPNIVDDTAIVTGGYTLQYVTKGDEQVKQTSGKVTLVFANEAETWRIIRAE